MDKESACNDVRGWYECTTHNQHKPMIKVIKILKENFAGLMNYIDHRITNAISEGFKRPIQSIKSAAQEFRDFDNYRTRILLYVASLISDLKA